MNFLLNPRFIGKKRQQGDETMGKPANKLGSFPSWQERRASSSPALVDNYLICPLRRAFRGSGREGTAGVRRHRGPSCAAANSGRLTRVRLRAPERTVDASIITRERDLSEGKHPLPPSRAPAILGEDSRFHLFFAFLWRLGVPSTRSGQALAVRFLILD